jgi:hypothetical protein
MGSLYGVMSLKKHTFYLSPMMKFHLNGVRVLRGLRKDLRDLRKDLRGLRDFLRYIAPTYVGATWLDARRKSRQDKV